MTEKPLLAKQVLELNAYPRMVMLTPRINRDKSEEQVQHIIYRKLSIFPLRLWEHTRSSIMRLWILFLRSPVSRLIPGLLGKASPQLLIKPSMYYFSTSKLAMLKSLVSPVIPDWISTHDALSALVRFFAAVSSISLPEK